MANVVIDTDVAPVLQKDRVSTPVASARVAGGFARYDGQSEWHDGTTGWIRRRSAVGLAGSLGAFINTGLHLHRLSNCPEAGPSSPGTSRSRLQSSDATCIANLCSFGHADKGRPHKLSRATRPPAGPGSHTEWALGREQTTS